MYTDNLQEPNYNDLLEEIEVAREGYENGEYLDHNFANEMMHSGQLGSG